jgi:hypothetical protein
LWAQIVSYLGAAEHCRFAAVCRTSSSVAARATSWPTKVRLLSASVDVPLRVQRRLVSHPRLCELHDVPLCMLPRRLWRRGGPERLTSLSFIVADPAHMQLSVERPRVAEWLSLRLCCLERLEFGFAGRLTTELAVQLPPSVTELWTGFASAEALRVALRRLSALCRLTLILEPAQADQAARDAFDALASAHAATLASLWFNLNDATLSWLRTEHSRRAWCHFGALRECTLSVKDAMRDDDWLSDVDLQPLLALELHALSVERARLSGACKPPKSLRTLQCRRSYLALDSAWFAPAEHMPALHVCTFSGPLFVPADAWPGLEDALRCLQMPVPPLCLRGVWLSAVGTDACRAMLRAVVRVCQGGGAAPL